MGSTNLFQVTINAQLAAAESVVAQRLASSRSRPLALPFEHPHPPPPSFFFQPRALFLIVPHPYVAFPPLRKCYVVVWYDYF